MAITFADEYLFMWLGLGLSWSLPGHRKAGDIAFPFNLKIKMVSSF
jgi:hypothetical protein